MTEEYTVPEKDEGERIDRFLAASGEYSRSFLQKLLKAEKVLVNDCAVKSSYRLEAGDSITFEVPEPEDIHIEAEDIVYEDASVILVNKPKGMVVHPAPGHYSGTLVNALMYHCRNDLSGINGELRPGIVHRIDRDTTGILIVCKNDAAHRFVAEQLKEHSITRRYFAIVRGNLTEDEGTVDKPIGRHPTDRKKMSINEKHGRRAVTHYRVLERFGDYTYITCRLETGRTHQIRVHMKHIGHPLFSDEKYGGCEILKGLRTQKYRQYIENCFALCPRQVLHARTLGFTHPRTGERMFFDSEWPEDMTNLINKGRNYEPTTLG